MRVMHILDSLNRGGAEVLALDVCRNAHANGLDLTFAATGGGDLEDDFRRSGVEFIRLQRRLPFDPKLAAQLREVIKKRGVEVVHTHQAVEALHAHFAARGLKTKRVLSFHLCTADAKNRLALKFLAPRTDANVAVSRDLLECLKRDAGFRRLENFHLVYNGVDATRLKAAGAGSLRAELGLAGGDLLLGMVGNFYADGRKDQLTVCRALPRLFSENANAHFVFVGARSPDAPHIYDECVAFCREQRIDGRVHFLGKRADVPLVLNSLDIFVLSSVQEGLGIAAIEAMLAGLPVVVSDAGALVEVAGEGRYASVFRTGDADALAAKLLELAGDAALRARRGAEGREWATRQFGIESHIANLLDLYGKLTGAP